MFLFCFDGSVRKVFVNQYLIIFCCCLYFNDVVFWNGLQPYALPNAADCGVPHASAVFTLFSIREFQIRSICSINANLIFFPGQFFPRYDIGERQITVIMESHIFTINNNFGKFINGVKVKQDNVIFQIILQIKLFSHGIAGNRLKGCLGKD